MGDVDDLHHSDYQERGIKSADTKLRTWGPDELYRAGKHAAWTKRNRGADPALNPWTRQNYYSALPPQSAPVLDDPDAGTDIASEPNDLAVPEDFSAYEGQVCLVQRMSRTRVRVLTELKKQEALTAAGALLCEACGFSFEARYGPRGHRYCEVHHEVSISDRVRASPTYLTELRVLCANCHRMVHRKRPWLTFSELRALIVGAD